jgi:hypothetical protein
MRLLHLQDESFTLIMNSDHEDQAEEKLWRHALKIAGISNGALNRNMGLCCGDKPRPYA